MIKKIARLTLILSLFAGCWGAFYALGLAESKPAKPSKNPYGLVDVTIKAVEIIDGKKQLYKGYVNTALFRVNKYGCYNFYSYTNIMPVCGDTYMQFGFYNQNVKHRKLMPGKYAIAPFVEIRDYEVQKKFGGDVNYNCDVTHFEVKPGKPITVELLCRRDFRKSTKPDELKDYKFELVDNYGNSIKKDGLFICYNLVKKRNEYPGDTDLDGIAKLRFDEIAYCYLKITGSAPSISNANYEHATADLGRAEFFLFDRKITIPKRYSGKILVERKTKNSRIKAIKCQQYTDFNLKNQLLIYKGYDIEKEAAKICYPLKPGWSIKSDTAKYITGNLSKEIFDGKTMMEFTADIGKGKIGYKRMLTEFNAASDKPVKVKLRELTVAPVKWHFFAEDREFGFMKNFLGWALINRQNGHYKLVGPGESPISGDWFAGPKNVSAYGKGELCLGDYDIYVIPFCPDWYCYKVGTCKIRAGKENLVKLTHPDKRKFATEQKFYLYDLLVKSADKK